MNLTARRNDNSCNIQRIKCLECNTLFDELKNNTTVQEQKFMIDFNKSIDLSEFYDVRVYLTWSLTHNLYPPSITTLNTDEIICKEGDIGYPYKIFLH